MIKDKTYGDDSAIVIYDYSGMPDQAYFRSLLEKYFRHSGHVRRLEFRDWDCYDELPGRDGDLYIYDTIMMTALADKGYIHQLPEVINVDGMFEWLIDRAKVRKKTYGVPLMLCGNALICRKKDDRHITNVMELNEETAIPMRSMALYYLLDAFCTYQDHSEKSFRMLEHLTELMGGKDKLRESTLHEDEAINRFINGDVRYLLGYTEYLSWLKPDDYAVCFPDFSDAETDEMPLFMSDFVSLGMHAEGEKLLDCLDLLEIMTDDDFIYDLCFEDGKLQYMLPACRGVYQRLAKADPLYNELYRILDNDNNGILRYGVNYYEDFNAKSDLLVEMLMGDIKKEWL